MANVEDVANYIIARVDDVDNLKLQKLLYYCQAVNLVVSGKPLFEDKIEAWLYGPVVPVVYRKYRRNGELPIPKPKDWQLLNSSLTSEEIEAIDMALRFYGSFTGPELIDRTHCEKPWIDAYRQGANTEISHASIKNYFSAALKFSE